MEPSWNDRQKYVMYITMENWVLMGLGLLVVDWNPAFQTFVVREWGFGDGGLGLNYGGGALGGLFGLPLVAYLIHRFGVGWTALYTSPWALVWLAIYSGIR